MRWTGLFILCASIAKFAEAAVPESLAGSFVAGLSLTAAFGSTTVRDDSTTTIESISDDAPVISIAASSGSPIASNTLFTVVLLDITGTTDPAARAVLHFVASNLRAPSGTGGELGGGTTDFAYQPPSGNAQLVLLAFVQPEGDTELDSISNGAAFSLSDFLRTNDLESAVTGFGFTVTGNSITTPITPSNSTTTTSSQTTTKPPQPPPLITSTYTLSQDGSVVTIVTVVPGGPDATSLEPSPTENDPSLITNDPNAGSQNVVSKSALALLGFSAFFIAFI